LNYKINIALTETMENNCGLKISYTDDEKFEIGVDEAGRGPMFGPVYVAAVILPKGAEFAEIHDDLKDSKRFTSKKKIEKLAARIKETAIAWSVKSASHEVIDKINIRQAVLKSMHAAISDSIKNVPQHAVRLLIDGNDFPPYMTMSMDPSGNGAGMLTQVPHVTIEGGDNKYTAIAAASILAKVDRDAFIDDLCEKHNYLKDHYKIHTNKGYGTMHHMAGIRAHGISPWHRKSYGLCKKYAEDVENKTNTE
jgi:ribonuclease HII